MFSPNDIGHRKQYFNLTVLGKDTLTSSLLSTAVSSQEIYGTNRNYLSHRDEPKTHCQVRGMEEAGNFF